MSGVTTYEYNTQAGDSNPYVVKHGSATSGVLPPGTTLSAGLQFAYGGKVYTYEGGADSGDSQVGFFAESKNGKIHFFSTTQQTRNASYELNASQGYTVSCFVRGTRIAAPGGEEAVEAIAVGDMVATRQGGETVFMAVKWVGRRRIDLTTHPRPETVAPVLIQRGAFADNVPHRGLTVSPDHAIFVDGKLICARQLINGTTIRPVKGLREVEYFHVELDRHAILLAEGLPVESYLNTGHRGFFSNAQEPLELHPDLTSEEDHPARAAGSCAPFVCSEDGVKPVWDALSARASAMGQAAAAIGAGTDPGLRIAAQGRILRPVSVKDGRHCFVLRQGVTEVRLVSRAASPTDVRPWLDDRRRLGVNVERIVLRSGQATQEIAVDHPALSDGWWDVEPDGMAMRRWTDGDAVLRLPVNEGAVLLEIGIADSGMIYPADAGEQRSAA